MTQLIEKEDDTLFDTRGRMQLRTGCDRKASLRWLQSRQAFLFHVTEPSAFGSDPVSWGSELSLGELILALRIKREDVKTAVLLHATLMGEEVDPSLGWGEQECKQCLGRKSKKRKR